MRSMRMENRSLALAILSIGLVSPIVAQAGRAPSARSLDEYFSAFARENRIPGLSVAVVGEGKVIWSAGYGTDGRGAAMTPETRLCLGSVSKSFTSLAILQLAERGLVDLEAPYRRYVPWFSVDGPGAEKITVRQLLTHTSGLDERGDPRPEIPGASPEDEVRSLARVRPSAEPGTRYAYYNKNYRALGYLVEAASGLPYGEYLRREVFEPLGMEGASTDPAGIAAGSAPFFGLPVPVSTSFCPGDAPAGGLVMSAAEAAKYLAALMDASGGRAVGPGFLDQLRQVPEGVRSRYGLGWTVERDGQRLIHGGDVSGFHAYAEVNLDTCLGCIVLCRQNGLGEMLGCYDQLPMAVHALLGGGPVPDPREFAWLPALPIGLAALILAYQAWRFARLPAWLGKARRRGPALRAALLLASAAPSALLLGLPGLCSALSGLACTWADLFRFLPDLALLALLAAAAGLVRGGAKALMLWRLGRAEA